MRGKAGAAQRSLSPSRITPACAGKSTQYFPACSCIWDHPRVCGEKDRVVIMVLATMGSPPRMRGKGSRIRTTRTAGRITPACAGKRRQTSVPSAARGDHPRVCGEKSSSSSRLSCASGSPPRMRGKDHAVHHRIDCVGITPACAEKSPGQTGGSQWVRDHPRACREKFHPASDRKLGRVPGTKRSSGPAPAAAPAGLAGSCPASPPCSYPPCITVSRPRP